MSINSSRFYGIGLSLLAMAALAACSSDNTDTPSTGSSAGTTSHAGTLGIAGSVGTAGTPGAGGTIGAGGSGTAGSGTAGTATTAGTGTGGSGGATGTACAGTKPAAALITEFADLTPNAMNAGQFTFTLGVPGGTFAYQKGVFTLTDAAKSLNIKGNVKAFDGFGVYTTACTDASAYTGVSFNIKGNVGPGGKLNFRVQTNADTTVDTVNKKGSCMVPPGTTDTYPLCHASSVDIPVSAGGAVVEVKFADLIGGVPVPAVNGKDIIGFEWAFAWMDGGTAYDVDVTLDDVKFTGGTPTGGTGGSGGAGGGGAGGGGAGGAAGNGGAGGNH